MYRELPLPKTVVRMVQEQGMSQVIKVTPCSDRPPELVLA